MEIRVVLYLSVTDLTTMQMGSQPPALSTLKRALVILDFVFCFLRQPLLLQLL